MTDEFIIQCLFNAMYSMLCSCYIMAADFIEKNITLINKFSDFSLIG